MNTIEKECSVIMLPAKNDNFAISKGHSVMHNNWIDKYGNHYILTRLGFIVNNKKNKL